MRRALKIAAAVLAFALGALAQTTQSSAALPRDAAKALFVDSNLSQARHDAAAALDAHPTNLEALFVTMEAAALQADTAAELDAAVRLCELQVRDPRVDIAAARVLDLAANTSAFRAVAPRIRELARAEGAQADYLRIALLAAAQEGLPGPSVLEMAHQAGFLTDWRLAGPFGRFPNVDFERPWPPERDALARPIAGNAAVKEAAEKLGSGVSEGRGFSRAEHVVDSCHSERTSVREESAFPGFPAACESDQFPDGNLALPGQSSRKGVYYASTQVTLPASGDWALRVESAGTLIVFVDGKPALTRDDRFRSQPAIVSARMKLAAGRHAVLVKFLPSASPFRIALARPRYQSAVNAASTFSRQEQLYLKAAQQYWAADYAGALATLSAYPRPSAALTFLQAQAWAHLANGTPEERSSLNAILAAAPDAYSAETMLAARDYSEDRLDDALPRVVRVVAARSDFAPAQQLRYQIAAHLHWQADAADAISALMRLHPACSVLRDASTFFRSTDQYQRAAEAEEAMRSCAPAAHKAAEPDQLTADSAHLRAIDPSDAFYTPFRRDGPQLVRATASRLFSGGPAVVLLDARVLRLRADGGADLYVHKLTRVLDHDGIERYGEADIPGGADLLELRTLTPAGDVAAEPELDSRKPTISMPALAPGHVIEREYVAHYPAGAADASRPFSYQFGSFEAPILFARFVVISPASLRMKISRASGVPSPTVFRAAGEEVRVWEKNDIAQSVQEPAMPRAGQLPEAVIAPFVVADWADVRRYYRNAIIEVSRSGERVGQFAATLPGATIDEKAHALYRALTSQVRASSRSLEAGLTPAEDTLVARDGSRTAVFLATARALGIPSELVVAREIGSPVPRQASLDAFTHPLVRLELRTVRSAERHIIVDLESDGLPFGSLPPTLDRSRALLVPVERASASAPLFIALPGTADSEQSLADGDVAFDADGNLSAKLRITLGTWRASQIRSILRGIAPGGRQRFFEQLATRIFPGAMDVVGDAVNENDPQRPLELRVRCRAPHFLNSTGGSTDLDQLAPALGLRKMYAGTSARRFPLYIDNPLFETTRFRVRLPDTLRVAELAPDFTAEGRFGNYAVRFRQTSPHEFEITRSFHIPVQVIPPAEYPEFARFAIRVDDVERQRLTLERADLSAKK